MSWIRESNLNWLHLAFARILKYGEIPHHVAFIMDGNRRFARKINVVKAEGHVRGFDKLAETLQWCLDLGIKEVTVYAFSIENFKRSKEEVDCLMDLARDKFKRLLDEKQKLIEKDVRIHFLGNTGLLPADLQDVMREVEDMTANHSSAILNVAFSYTAQDDIARAVKLMVRGLQSGKLKEDDLSVALFEKCLDTSNSRPPDIIVRTSGETRLSDFLLFQGCFSYLAFVDVLWPELTAWQFFRVIFDYQYALRNFQSHVLNYRTCDFLTTDAQSFVLEAR